MLTLMQGAPGSGKSTQARYIQRYQDAQPYSPGCRIVSTDDFHTSDGTDYLYDPSSLAYYHAWCQWECDYWLSLGYDVVVDNTNIRRWQAEPYIAMAERHGVSVQVIRCEGDYGSIHWVPTEAVARMKREMEDLL